jgi:hypothetical protein
MEMERREHQADPNGRGRKACSEASVQREAASLRIPLAVEGKQSIGAEFGCQKTGP